MTGFSAGLSILSLLSLLSLLSFFLCFVFGNGIAGEHFHRYCVVSDCFKVNYHLIFRFRVVCSDD